MIGNLHQSETCGKTQEYKFIQVSADNVCQYGEIAISVLKHTLLDASYMFVNTNGKLNKEKRNNLKISREAFAFLSGSGLDIMLKSYDLDYNPDEIRYRFYTRFHVE